MVFKVGGDIFVHANAWYEMQQLSVYDYFQLNICNNIFAHRFFSEEIAWGSLWQGWHGSSCLLFECILQTKWTCHWGLISFILISISTVTWTCHWGLNSNLRETFILIFISTCIQTCDWGLLSNLIHPFILISISSFIWTCHWGLVSNLFLTLLSPLSILCHFQAGSATFFYPKIWFPMYTRPTLRGRKRLGLPKLSDLSLTSASLSLALTGYKGRMTETVWPMDVELSQAW